VRGRDQEPLLVNTFRTAIRRPGEPGVDPVRTLRRCRLRSSRKTSPYRLMRAATRTIVRRLECTLLANCAARGCQSRSAGHIRKPVFRIFPRSFVQSPQNLLRGTQTIAGERQCQLGASQATPNTVGFIGFQSMPGGFNSRSSAVVTRHRSASFSLRPSGAAPIARHGAADASSAR
jgi:hypothetical protein